MSKSLTTIFIVAALFASCNYSNTSAHKQHGDSAHHAGMYQCHTDCEKGKMYDSAGKCPVCKKDLEKK